MHHFLPNKQYRNKYKCQWNSTSIIIGKRGSSSAALYDHHALAWLPSNAPDTFRLAIPIDEHTTASEYYDYSSPSIPYLWTQSGAYIFTINTGQTPSLKRSGQLITETLDNNLSRASSNYDRLVLQGKALHFIHNSTVYSTGISD